MTEEILKMLPPKILKILMSKSNGFIDRICEIRLRNGLPFSVSTYSENLLFTDDGEITNQIGKACVCHENDISHFLSFATAGSLYKYTESILSGYIVTNDGARVGIAGECIYDGGKVSSICKISSLNIRIPHNIECGLEIAQRLSKTKNSMLIFSPPGYGKTTVIRNVSKALASGRFTRPMRVSVIDEKGEIFPERSSGLCDVFSGYKKPYGIDVAVRLMNPEYIVLDEIGLSDDIDALLSVQNAGVPVIATCHGRSYADINNRPIIKKLIENNVFDEYAKIEKESGKMKIEIITV